MGRGRGRSKKHATTTPPASVRVFSPHSSTLVGANARKKDTTNQKGKTSRMKNAQVDKKDVSGSTKENQRSTLEVMEEEAKEGMGKEEEIMTPKSWVDIIRGTTTIA
ncbi:uncharacterized protein LOC127088247 isoform X2 [Lathyrus oleraceus]|uniref:uncharacterized protein LOC127088247 isoform X2 n=1 Tax=Pisum sativum TaxID=3888 RepID=UPI0021D33EB8|nr:uncharacterized protein LOC127088247 isoform X2 [Pisum sativum]